MTSDCSRSWRSARDRRPRWPWLCRSPLAPPRPDLHFYSRSDHDCPPEKFLALTRRGFDSWEWSPAGRLIVHELRFHDDRPGTTAVVGSRVAMLWWTEGKPAVLGLRPSPRRCSSRPVSATTR